ncbi:MAG: response regulator, partial [Gammaproteobacteria bacterium]|nr:response regulator [Gammaproteobacteria bacterium]
FNADPVLTEISPPYGTWQLAAIPKQGWLGNTEKITAFRISLFVIGLIILVPIFILSRSMEKQKESDALLRSLFTFSPIGIALNNFESGDFVKINNVLLSNSGYSSDEFMKLGFRDVFQDDTNFIGKSLLDSLEQTGHYGPYEAEFIRKNGSQYPVALKGMLIHDSGGKKMIWSFVEDISKRKQAEKSLQRSQKMDAIGQLTGGIAHDFNNILSIILGYLELLKLGLSDASETTLKRIDTIQSAGQRAVDLTKQLLSFSRNKPSRQDVTDINNIVRKMENLIARSVTPEIEVVKHLAKDLWLTRIDPGDLEDALLNLCINARDAISVHGQISISTRNATVTSSETGDPAKAGDFVEIIIKDNGCGIPPEQQEHIFEPFYTTKSEGKGTGLGLSMVYGFVQRSLGFIDVDSRAGVGTSIKLYIPRYTGTKIPSAQNSNDTNSLLPRGTENILVVDDEVAIVEMVTSLLEKLGYTAYNATSGEQALQLLRDNPRINLLFTDVVMPGNINGYELAERAQKAYPELKILLTSGYTGKIPGNRSTQAEQSQSSTDILNKPYTHQELAARIRSMLDK